MAGAEPDLLAWGGFESGDVILDLGGGRGGVVAGAPARGLRAVVVDRSARALADVCCGVRADLSDLPFGHSVVDGALLRAVMHHVLDPARVLREASRVLKPGACVVIVDRVAAPEDAAHALRNAVDRLRDAHHVSTWSVDELSAMGMAARLAEEERHLWQEEKDLDEWLDRTGASPRNAGWVHEMVEADRLAGGTTFGAVVVDGAVRVQETWCALRLRRLEGRR